MDARLVAAARLPGLSGYGAPYTSPNFSGYFPYTPAAAAVAAATADTSAFYPALVRRFFELQYEKDAESKLKICHCLTKWRNDTFVYDYKFKLASLLLVRKN